MVFILTVIVFFLKILKFLVFYDIVASWISLSWIKARFAFVASILDPIYGFIKSKITTTIGPFELSALIVLIGTEVISTIILSNSPETALQVEKFFTSF